LLNRYINAKIFDYPFLIALGLGIPVNASAAALQNEQPQVNASYFGQTAALIARKFLTDILPPFRKNMIPDAHPAD